MSEVRERVPARSRRGQAGGEAPSLRRVVVAGAGLAGLYACEGLREGGFDGELALVGAEPHPPYDRPPLSKQFLAGTWGLDRVVLRTPERLERLDLDLRLGVEVNALDLHERRVQLGDGTSLAFDGLVVATGSVPRLLSGMPAGADGLHVLRTLEDCLALGAVLDKPGARVVIVGAGFIGSEVASTAAARGASVTVVEAMPVPLAGALGEEMGRACAGLHHDGGVRLHLGVGVDEVTTAPAGTGNGASTAAGAGRRVTGVRLADGTSIEADAVVIGVGVRPVTAWLEGSGLELSDGVVCDETLHAAPGVVAAGDVARWDDRRAGVPVRVEHWENAVEQGRHAAASLLAGAGAVPFDSVPYFWSDQYGVKIQFVGSARAGDEVVVADGAVAERRFAACYGREGRLVGALAFSRPRLLMRYRGLVAEGASFEEALALPGA